LSLKLVIIQRFSYSVLRFYKLDTSFISILKYQTHICVEHRYVIQIKVSVHHNINTINQ